MEIRKLKQVTQFVAEFMLLMRLTIVIIYSLIVLNAMMIKVEMDDDDDYKCYH